MSIDIFFNKNVDVNEMLEKTSLTIHNKFGRYYLCDSCGNAVHLYSYNSGDDKIDGFCVRNTNPYKILDELVETFNIQFIDDDGFQLICQDKSVDVDSIYINNMNKHGYLILDGKIKIEDREEGFYNNKNGCKPCEEDDREEELPF
jgi:hypothetical protein